MHNNTVIRLIALAGMTCAAANGAAAVSAEEAARLGKDLTPTGAVRAGSEDGVIPPWKGGITGPPEGYERGDFHPNPYADDEVRFVIDQNNYEQYRDKLTAGHIALLEKYDTFEMHVYPTRRSASYPEYQYEGTRRNATKAELINDGNGLSLNTETGIPFPIPQNAKEVIWNHKMHYRGGGPVTDGNGFDRLNNQATVTDDGAYEPLIVLRERAMLPFAPPGTTVGDLDNILFYLLQTTEAPARLAGGALLVHETVDQVSGERQAWTYNPGQRRVRRAPNVAYDNPGTASDGLRTNDMSDMFNGALDRYDWELKGKKAMFVPYNSYRLHSGDISDEDIIQPHHIDPELTRYELHRVWIVEATLKEDVRHIHARRRFYVDEDSWQILSVDHYEDQETLWQVSEAHCINYYELPTFWTTLETHHDLQSGRYLAMGLDNDYRPYDFSFNKTEPFFKPSGLRRIGRR